MYNDNLKPLVFWCQKVLPLVYDDSLSYYEVVCKCANKINELIENYNNLPDIIKELVTDDNLKVILLELYNQLEEQIASANEGTSKTATANRNVGDLVWLDGNLYKVTHSMIAGDQYVNGSNCIKTTIENEIKVKYVKNDETIIMKAIIS